MHLVGFIIRNNQLSQAEGSTTILSTRYVVKCRAFHIEFTENDMVLWKWLICWLSFTVPDISPLVLHTHTISL